MDKALVMQRALAAELERTRQELKPDREGFERGLRAYRHRSWLLSRRLLQPTRRGLTEEAMAVYSQGWTQSVIGRLVDLLFSPDADTASPQQIEPELHETSDSEQRGSMPAEFMPRHDEVETLAIELAQLLLSNWTGFMRFQSVEARRGAISALYESPPSLPPQITEGCAAYPVSNEDCCAILAAFLVAEDRFTGDQSEDC